MRKMSFSEAVEDALLQAMTEDPRIIYLGEDAHAFRANLFVQFGEKRVKPTPISEAAFLGAAVTAAMSGLRPVVEFMLVDFIGVALDGAVVDENYGWNKAYYGRPVRPVDIFVAHVAINPNSARLRTTVAKLELPQ